jgi:hypothetical protein
MTQSHPALNKKDIVNNNYGKIMEYGTTQNSFLKTSKKGIIHRNMPIIYRGVICIYSIFASVSLIRWDFIPCFIKITVRRYDGGLLHYV